MFELKLENESGEIVNINDEVNYIVTAVSGLNPPSATIFTTKSPNRKGSKYNGSTLGERNIIISIRLQGDIEEARNNLYPWIDTEQYVKIYYSNGIKSVYCEGHIQDCEFDLFTENETISLAIICEDPYFKALEEIAVSMSSTVNAFTFPFAIETSGIPISTNTGAVSIWTINEGAETGAIFELKVNRSYDWLALVNSQNENEVIRFDRAFVAGDVIHIDTSQDLKICKVFEGDGTEENLMKYIKTEPTWFVLKKGMNIFRVSSTQIFPDGVEITIRYQQKYLGV